jgi:hypothetical protein
VGSTQGEYAAEGPKPMPRGKQRSFPSYGSPVFITSLSWVSTLTNFCLYSTIVVSDAIVEVPVVAAANKDDITRCAVH